MRSLALGGNGSGKTTTFKALTRKIAQYMFSIIGKNINVIKKNIGYVPQEAALFDLLTVSETLSHYFQVKGVEVPNRDLAQRYRLDNVYNSLALTFPLEIRILFAIALLSNPKNFPSK